MIHWKSNSPIWAAYSGNPPCNLCGQANATEYYKGHERKNGVHLEFSLMYCKDCNGEASDADWEKCWNERWAACEADCEKNWQEHGVYCNVSDGELPSKYFGYAKLEDGSFKPYYHVHPELPEHFFEIDREKIINEIVAKDISESDKFQLYREFLDNYKSDVLEVQEAVRYEIKRLDYRTKMIEDELASQVL